MLKLKEYGYKFIIRFFNKKFNIIKVKLDDQLNNDEL